MFMLLLVCGTCTSILYTFCVTTHATDCVHMSGPVRAIAQLGAEPAAAHSKRVRLRLCTRIDKRMKIASSYPVLSLSFYCS